MHILNIIAHILLIIGGLNWGFIGLFDMNFVDMIFANLGIERAIYILVGLAALWQCFCFKRCCTAKA